MEKNKLVEIHKGETGTGLLIENDGFISKDCGNNNALFESLNKLNEDVNGNDFHCPYPFIVDAIFQKADVENANGRIYPKHILEREIAKFQTKIKEKASMGEANHPDSSIIDISRISINIIELHWEKNTVVGKLEIITSPGFRKYGIVSTTGDEAANLILQGYKLGVSSRGLGSVTQKMGVLYVGEDFELITWDLVSEPSTPAAFLYPNGEIPEQFIENKESTKNNTLFEKLNKFDNWLNV